MLNIFEEEIIIPGYNNEKNNFSEFNKLNDLKDNINFFGQNNLENKNENNDFQELNILKNEKENNNLLTKNIIKNGSKNNYPQELKQNDNFISQNIIIDKNNIISENLNFINKDYTFPKGTNYEEELSKNFTYFNVYWYDPNNTNDLKPFEKCFKNVQF